MKKLRLFWVFMVMLLGMSTIAMADSGVKIKVNGKLLSDTQAIIQHGTTLLPVRSIGTALGGEVTWDSATQTAIVEKGDIKVVAPVGERYIYANDEAIHLTVVAQVINGRTYLPLRVMGEALNCNINWVNETKTVEISDNGGTKDLFEVDNDVELGPFFLDNRIYLTVGETIPVRVRNGGIIEWSDDNINCEWGTHNGENVVMVEGLHRGNCTLTLSNLQEKAKITVSVVNDTDANYLLQKAERIANGYDIHVRQEALIETEERVKEEYGINLECVYEKNFIVKGDVLIIPIDSNVPLTGTFYLNISGNASIWPTMEMYNGKPALFIKGIQQTSSHAILRYINNSSDLRFEEIDWNGEPKLIWEREDVRTSIDPAKVDTTVWEFDLRVINSGNKDLKKQNEERLAHGISYDLYLNGQA